MASKGKNNKNEKKGDYRAQQLRRNQIIFGIVAVILILSMTLSLFINL